VLNRSIEHFPPGGLRVDAPPVDSSLTRGFRAGGMPFQSHSGVSASSAPANGNSDVAHSPMCGCGCVCGWVSVGLLQGHIGHVYVHSVSAWAHSRLRVLTTKCTSKRREVYCLCRSRSRCFSGSSFVLALPSAVDFLSVSDSRVSVCASVHCLVPLTFLKSADC